MSYVVRSLATIGLVASVVAACADHVTAPETPTPASSKTASGGAGMTTLLVSKSAAGYYENVTEYDWALETKVSEIMGKDMLPEPSVSTTAIPVGDVKWIMYDFKATRTPLPLRSETGVRGSICVTNSGRSPTQNLFIADIVQLRLPTGQVSEIRRALVDLGGSTVLAPGARQCYPYSTPFTGTPGTVYRSVAQVWITNYAQQSVTPDMALDFGLPRSQTAATRFAQALLQPGIAQPCANVFPSLICTGSEGFRDMVLADSKTFTYPRTVDAYNFHVCGEELPFTSLAKLTELGPYDTGVAAQTHTASATLTFITGECPPKPSNPSCTVTQGYWKNHDWPLHPIWPPSTLATWPDIVGWKFFDSDMEWPDVLNVEPKGDPYLILAHQYIAAILNQQNGAYVPEEVRQVLVDAYVYFSSSPAERGTVSRDLLLRWKDVLDAYNNGRAGVPDCG
jgi:hypothetical protein